MFLCQHGWYIVEREWERDVCILYIIIYMCIYTVFCSNSYIYICIRYMYVILCDCMRVRVRTYLW
jgi:hypothetical protein